MSVGFGEETLAVVHAWQQGLFSSL